MLWYLSDENNDQRIIFFFGAHRLNQAGQRRKEVTLRFALHRGHTQHHRGCITRRSCVHLVCLTFIMFKNFQFCEIH